MKIPSILNRFMLRFFIPFCVWFVDHSIFLFNFFRFSLSLSTQSAPSLMAQCISAVAHTQTHRRVRYTHFRMCSSPLEIPDRRAQQQQPQQQQNRKRKKQRRYVYRHSM